MRGDFSRWQYNPRDNFNGVLPQQGKLLIDADGIAQTRIANHWQETAARDVIGPVAGVPASEPNSFAITQAVVNGDAVTLTIGSGRMWADGLLVQLGETGTVTREATWLEPPLVPTEGDAGSIAAGVVDTVFLEVWQEGINGYQMPHALIEPALGGPDTAERLHTGTAFRLARLTQGQTCTSIAFDDSAKGKLTATLQPPTVIAGDCPLPAGGGYSGFEHRLYRVEIAAVNAGDPASFKWSRENGGLVGRGLYASATQAITITANLVAITTANRATFYLEIEKWDAAAGNFATVFGGMATVNDGTLELASPQKFGNFPADGEAVFFRLWDDLRAVSDFPIAVAPNELEDGIFLQFDADGPGVYRSKDYWTFPVRANGIANPQTLIDHKRPEGIRYNRVPIAEIIWGNGTTSTDIEDCRVIVHPLGRKSGCCTRQVGDGVASFGQFTSIQAAIDSLPPKGGEVCILAGRYVENITIEDRTGVTIHGCGNETRIASAIVRGQKSATTPVIAIVNSQGVEIRSLVVEAADGAFGIALEGDSTDAVPQDLETSRGVADGVSDVRLRELIVTASTRSAVSAVDSTDVRLENSLIAMKDVLSIYPAVFVSGEEIHVVNNRVGIISAENLPAIVAADLGLTDTTVTSFAAISNPMIRTPGGIQIGGPSRDVYVRYNEIDGGSGTGIVLGSIVLVDGNGNGKGGNTGNPTGPKNPCDPGSIGLPGSTTGTNQEAFTIQVAGRLIDIHIENNRIRSMGLCGIGPVGFFDIAKTQEVVVVEILCIAANEIENCLRRDLSQAVVLAPGVSMVTIGYGAICLPDVAQAVVRDNCILDTGASLADAVCGIFVLHGEQVEISRNQIIDVRDFDTSDASSISGFRAGIAIVMVTPPEARASSGFTNIGKATTGFLNGAPALTIIDNAVNIPAGLALSVAGIGAFSIRGNQFATGGALDSILTLARGVIVMNFGSSLEIPAPVTNSQAILTLLEEINDGVSTAQALQTVAGSIKSVIGSIAVGPVNFSGNRCAVEQEFRAEPALSSILIFTADDLGFHDNQCWLDSIRGQVECNAFLLGLTLRATGNRFQEPVEAVQFSAVTFGIKNITSWNESTNLPAALGPTGNVIAQNL